MLWVYSQNRKVEKAIEERLKKMETKKGKNRHAKENSSNSF